MILAIDTATLDAGAAVVQTDGLVVAVRRVRVTIHSDALLTMVDAVLKEAGIGPADLDAVACGAGPGSFTGLRIGLATAKGLCLALEKPLIMVSSLQALAAQVPAGTLAIPILDAFRGELYAGFYRAGDPPQPLSDEVVAPPERVRQRIEELIRQGEVPMLIGDGLGRWPVLQVDRPVIAGPDPVDVARIARHRWRRGESDDLDRAVPRYIRPSEAELKSSAPRNPSR